MVTLTSVALLVVWSIMDIIGERKHNEAKRKKTTRLKKEDNYETSESSFLVHTIVFLIIIECSLCDNLDLYIVPTWLCLHTLSPWHTAITS